MKVDDTTGKKVNDPLGDDFAVGDQRSDIRLELSQLVYGLAEFSRLQTSDVMLVSQPSYLG